MLSSFLKLFLALISTVFFFAVAVYPWASDDDFNGLRKNGDERFLDLVYFAVVSFSTAGYGDISPKSSRAKIMTSSFLLFVNIAAIYGMYSALIK